VPLEGRSPQEVRVLELLILVAIFAAPFLFGALAAGVSDAFFPPLPSGEEDWAADGEEGGELW